MSSKLTLLVVAAVIAIALATISAYLVGMSPRPSTQTAAQPTTSTPTSSPPVTSKLRLRWGTASVGSAGYTALALVADIINKYMPEVEITVIPTAGAVASIKQYSAGDLEGCYASDPSFKEFYTLTGRFAGFKPGRYPAQTFWVYTLEVGIAISKKNANKYKSWSDLNGTKMFTGPVGWDVGVILREMLDALNIKYQHVELDFNMIGDALEKGTIEATIIYTSSRSSLPDWAKQLELSTDIVILNPSPEEIKKLEKAGFVIVEVDAKSVFTRDVGVSKMYARAFFYGFHTGVEVPEEIVYKMLKTLEAHANELAQLHPMFKDLAADFAGFQAKAVKANANIPVHPGLARYLKEKGLWNDAWTIAK